ncbi:MAG: alpha/beta fold hydrolase, partial [Planctomycetota bacterium]|nr:alpha/beta fold hydrolase [Planctomycetota bacterium]
MWWAILILASSVLAPLSCDFIYARKVNAAIREDESSLEFNDRGIVRGGEPFHHMGKEPACLLIHGFRGSPRVFQGISNHLKAADISFDAILLPGHGRRLRDLAETGWQDWSAAVESAYLKMKERHGRVVVIGFSLGGLLGLKLASQHQVEALVVLSPFFRVNRARAGFIP